MAYTARELIIRAYYLSGVVARNFETVSGPQVSDGLYLLNALLSFSKFNTRVIPYFTRDSFTFTAGVERYFIPNLVEVETITFNVGSVRYPLQIVDRIRYFGNGRADGIRSFPFIAYPEKVKGGIAIYVYYLPDSNYVAEITGKFGLLDVDLDTDLAEFYDEGYIEQYLRFLLSQQICIENIIEFPQAHEKQLDKIIKQLSWQSPPDLNMKKTSLVNTRGGVNWQQINLGRGWYP